MSDLKQMILECVHKNQFLKFMGDNGPVRENTDNSILKAIIELNNSEEIDLIKEFSRLTREDSAQYDFFLLRHIFERLLPQLRTPLLPLMQCVLHLHREAGEDLAAGEIFKSYIVFAQEILSTSKKRLIISKMILTIFLTSFLQRL